MAFHSYRIDWYNKDSNGAYVTTATELQDILSISVSLGLGEIADSFSLTLNNYDDNQFDRVSIDDRLKIYGTMDGTTYKLLIDGVVQEKTNTSEIDNKIITITGLNRLEKLFNSLVATTGENVQQTSSYWVKHIIDQVNEFNNQGGTTREIKYVYKGLDQNGNAASPNTITTTTHKFTYIKSFEKAFKLIEELSQPDYTDDGAYIYSLDDNNYFHFEPKPQTITSEIDYGDEIKTHRTKKGMYQVINYIIMNCGKSPYGASILQMDYSDESINKFGWKVKLITRESIANELRDRDINLMKDKNVYSEDSIFPTSYDYTTVWGVTTTSDSNYNSEFVDECLVQGTKEINSLLNQTTGATYKVNVVADVSFDYVLGDLHKLVIPDNYWDNGYEIRIKTINYQFGTKGWSTDIKFEEDSEFQVS